MAYQRLTTKQRRPFLHLPIFFGDKRHEGDVDALLQSSLRTRPFYRWIINKNAAAATYSRNRWGRITERNRRSAEQFVISPVVSPRDWDRGPPACPSVRPPSCDVSATVGGTAASWTWRSQIRSGVVGWHRPINSTDRQTERAIYGVLALRRPSGRHHASSASAPGPSQADVTVAAVRKSRPKPGLLLPRFVLACFRVVLCCVERWIYSAFWSISWRLDLWHMICMLYPITRARHLVAITLQLPKTLLLARQYCEASWLGIMVPLPKSFIARVFTTLGK